MARQVAATALPGAEASSVLWRWHGQLQVTAVVKTTFAFIVGETHMVPVTTAPIVLDDEPPGPLARPCGIAPTLGAVDIILLGHARAPQGRPVSKLKVSFELWRGRERALTRSADAVGARGESGAIGSFTSMALADLGYGPILRNAPARAVRLRDFAALDREPIELPNDVDWSFFHAAPADMQVRQLFGNERIALIHMHPSVPRVEATLPPVSAQALLFGGDAPPAGKSVPLAADMLIVDADRRLCSIVWRGHVPVRGNAADLSIVGTVEHGAAAIAAARAQLAPTLDTSLGDTAEGPLGLGGLGRAPTLPFQPGVMRAPPPANLPRVITGTQELSPAAAAALRAEATPFESDTRRQPPPRNADPLLETQMLSSEQLRARTDDEAPKR